MTDFERKLVDMSEAELAMCIHNAAADLRSIAEATGSSFTVIASPDKKACIIKDGEIYE